MMPKRKNRRLGSFPCVGLVLVFFAGLGTARAATVQVDIRNSLIVLQARQAPVIDVLTAVAERTGISFETSDPLSEPVSLDFKDLTLEECIRRLLVNRNYSLVFEKNAQNAIVLKSIRITGSGPVTRVQLGPALPQPRPEAPSRERVIQRSYSKEWLIYQLENSKGLKRQIRVSDPEDSPAEGGVRITRIPRRSLLSQMGIRQGDVILNVNGTQIQSAGGLIEALRSASRKGETIRIERKLRNGRMEPIQIEIR